MNCNLILQEISKAFVGNTHVVNKILLTLLAGGHVLLEDIPGVGKTTLALAFSKVLALAYNRIQFTPDLLPTDITGYSVYNKETEKMDYRKGAAVCNLLLADEINRASSRAQSALLEVMEEGSVTVDGNTYLLPKPFFVIATQNPAGSAGTQLLPESQLDRFMVKLSIGYPGHQSETDMLRQKHGNAPKIKPETIVDTKTLLQMQHTVSTTYISDEIYDYIVRLIRATREHPLVKQGVSPRCSVALTALAQANAFLMGRDYVIPEDVQAVFFDCTSHRIILSAQAKQNGGSYSILNTILSTTQVPFVGKAQ